MKDSSERPQFNNSVQNLISFLINSHNAKQEVVVPFRLDSHTVADSYGVALMKSEDLFFIYTTE